MIRFQRIGRTNDPAFRIVVLEKERAAKAGNIVELLGTYNPRSKALTLNADGVKGWIAKGAQPTGSIHNLLINRGVISGKKVNVLSKKTPQKKEGDEAGAAVTAAPVADSASELPQGSEPAPAAPSDEPTPAEPTEAEVSAEAEAPAAEAPADAETPAI